MLTNYDNLTKPSGYNDPGRLLQTGGEKNAPRRQI